MATTKLDSLDVFTCAKAANHAYLKEPLIKKIYKNGEWSFIKFFENATWSTEAFLIHNISRKRALLAFRGSQELADFLFDIVSILPPLGKEKPQVNLMFNKLWESIKSDVLSEIAKLDGQYPGTRFYITGHSLGGALALACLDDISRILRFCIDRPIINTF